MALSTASHLSAQNTFPATGNVGIGTITPAYNLDISSASNTTLKIGSTVSSGYSDLIFKGSINQWKISKSPQGSGNSSAPGTLGISYNTNIYGGDHPLLSLTYTGSGWNSQFGSNSQTLFGGVNLAIEGSLGARQIIISNSDTYLLTQGSTTLLGVNGRISAREVVVTLTSAFPDYVFKPEYKLSSLSEVESYIKQNSRLPEMPSAEQVKKDGIEVGHMTTVLVQKIEELTLHIIEMNKKIEKLEAVNQSMKKQ